MLRSSLISALILAALPAGATGLVSIRVIERGDAERVKLAPGVAAGPEAAVDVVFGMGRAASRGFVAAAGRMDGGGAVTVSRGPQMPALCPGPGVRLP